MQLRFQLSARIPALLVAAALPLLLAACDPPAPDELLTPDQAQAFEVLASSADRAPVPADGALVIRLSAPVDPATVGRRSVSVFRRRGRRLRHTSVTARGNELWIEPAEGSQFPTGEVLRLRITGKPSPRALRSLGGALLRQSAEILFEVAPPTRRDLRGPELLSVSPASESTDVQPGSHIELTFSEPLARGSVVSGMAVRLHADGKRLRPRVHLSADGRVLVVRPKRPLPPAADVTLAVTSSLMDRSGNPAVDVPLLRFRTRATSLHELTEDFVSPEMADRRGTSAAWGAPATPGFLVAASDPLGLGPVASGDPLFDLGDRASVRFQMLLPAAEVPGGFASALHLVLAGEEWQGAVSSVSVEAGRFDLDALDPTFFANRRAARLQLAAVLPEELDAEPLGQGRMSVDIPFEVPLELRQGQSVLLDVQLEFAPGVRMTAFEDVDDRALVDQSDPLELAPAAFLLVTTGVPQARSLWYDSGVGRPEWQRATLIEPDGAAARFVVVEFQSAPAGADGQPDLDHAGDWIPELEHLEEQRFVRFRVRFVGLPDHGRAPRIDRLVMPFKRIDRALRAVRDDR